MRSYPKVRVVLHVTNRTVDLTEERFDVAFHVTSEVRDEAGMVIRVMAAEECYCRQSRLPEAPPLPKTPT
jgi:DNA-binding transcriptional LysR family regulator